MIRAALLLAASVGPGLDFEPWFTERSVAVAIARVTDRSPWIRAQGELSASAADVYAVVTDYRRYRELFDPAVKRADVLDGHGEAARIHFVWAYPFPFRDRDGIVAYRGERMADGSFLLAWEDAARTGDPREGARIAEISGETRIAPLGPERCRVTYTFLGDLGGTFPKAVREKAWRHEPLGYFYALRRRLGLSIPPK